MSEAEAEKPAPAPEESGDKEPTPIEKYGKYAGIVLGLGLAWSILKPKKKKEIEELSDEPVTSITVADGDTLYSLSRKYDVSVEDLKKVNGIDSDIIVTGTTLSIP
eukprot:TRINITY_DN982_c0_g1_i5.p2 TRINITY_DN982_c0_g1~~TRINITY_DN982_c0_g1_i5.p2  ORF type:complete len:106 (+),score=20.95 TRINITY_DN982_c0_g1_i5:103-420(+)